MKEIPLSLQTHFFSFFNKIISPFEFEQWLYKNTEIENVLEDEIYLELVSLNYKNKHILFDVQKIISPFINHGEYEKSKLVKILTDIIKGDKDFRESLLETYDLYCKGYDFLEILAIDFALSFEYQYNLSKWNKLSAKKRKRKINKIYPQVKKQAETILFQLNEKNIIPTGKYNENDIYSYIDKRTFSQVSNQKNFSFNFFNISLNLLS